jgi:hypothetical protein
LETANTDVIFHLDVYVDSGIRRGTDVVKDRCFCAKAVGVGFLDGNTYSMDFSHVMEVFSNTVYAMRDYSSMGFPTGEPYVGSGEQILQLRNQYTRNVEFQTRMKTPVWNGEFEPPYANPKYEPDHETINAQRYALPGEQMKIYNDEAKVSWTI